MDCFNNLHLKCKINKARPRHLPKTIIIKWIPDYLKNNQYLLNISFFIYVTALFIYFQEIVFF